MEFLIILLIALGLLVIAGAGLVASRRRAVGTRAETPTAAPPTEAAPETAEAEAAAVEEAASRMPASTLVGYPFGHFEIYHGKAFEEAVEHQIGFLATHLHR